MVVVVIEIIFGIDGWVLTRRMSKTADIHVVVDATVHLRFHIRYVKKIDNISLSTVAFTNGAITLCLMCFEGMLLAF